MSWLAEGVSTRVWFGHPNPVVHLVTESDELWCSGGRGRPAAIGMHTGTGGGRACPRCAALARQAIADETLDERDVPRFLP